METAHAIVIGAGPGGLAAAATLTKAGLDPVVLERSAHIGARWRTYYDRLRLESPSWLNNLPGYRIPRELGRWVARDAFVEYLERYVGRCRLDVRSGVMVQRIGRSEDGWEVTTSTGDWRTPYLIIATGYNNVPYIPPWPGLDGFAGALTHAAAFRNGRPFQGQDVLVVGAGNSGAEIALILAEEGARRVRLSVRTPPHIAPRQAFGMPAVLGAVMVRRLPARAADLILGGVARLVIGDLTRHGLRKPPGGIYTQYLRNKVTPILDTGFVGALKRGAVEIVSAVEGFDGGQVVLADGSRHSPDAIVAATGYRRGLDALVGHLGVLTPDGDPAAHGARCAPGAPGLHFIGYTHPFSGNIREIGIDARKIAHAIAKDRRRQLRPRTAPEPVAAGRSAAYATSDLDH